MEYAVSILDLEHLRSFAAGIAALLRPGDIIALSGPIGSGKTTLTREIVRYLAGKDSVSSPSFTIWQRYEGELPVNHLDLYRIENPAEIPELGLEEAIDAHSCTIIEWPERLPRFSSGWTLRISLEGSGDDARSVRIQRR